MAGRLEGSACKRSLILIITPQVLEATQIRRNNFRDICEKLKELTRGAMNEPAARIRSVGA